MSDENELTEIEKVFSKTVEKHLPEIQKKLAAANQLIEEAIKLSEKHGVPFHGLANNFSDSYIPKTMPKDLDSDLVSGLTEAWPGEYGNYAGWQTSHC